MGFVVAPVVGVTQNSDWEVTSAFLFRKILLSKKYNVLTQTIQIFLGLCNSSGTTQRSLYHANTTQVSLLWPYPTWSSTKWLHKKNPWWASLQPLYCAVGVYRTVFVNCGVILYLVTLYKSSVLLRNQTPLIKEARSTTSAHTDEFYVSSSHLINTLPPKRWSVGLTWKVRLTLSKSIN